MQGVQDIYRLFSRDGTRSDGGSAPSRRAPLSTHPAFSPVLIVWGFALWGLSVVVLPNSTASNLAALLGLTGLPLIWFALMAGFVGAGMGYGISSICKRVFARRPAQHEPRDEMPAANDAVSIVVDEWCEDIDSEDIGEIAPDDEALAASPVSLEEFSEVQPEPETVFVETDNGYEASFLEEEPQHSAVELEISNDPALDVETEPAAPSPTPVGAAIQALRAPAVSALSMMQLVERFAVALDGFQTRVGARTAFPSQSYEKLRALEGRGRGLPKENIGRFGGSTFDLDQGVVNQTYIQRSDMCHETIETEAALRDALKTLGRMSGAA